MGKIGNYGIPYLGSKSGKVEFFAGIFPKATHFYDLFGGGFSVTHCMLWNRSDYYKHFHFNEIRSGICELIQDSINGKYSYKNFNPEFIDRERFLKEKECNAYIKICWSFGNNGKTYLFSKEIGPYKKSMHNAIVFGIFDDLAKEVIGFNEWPKHLTINGRRLYLRRKLEHYRKTKIPIILYKFLNDKQLQQLEQLQRLERLKRLEQLQRLERLQQLQQLQQLLQLERLQQLERLEQLQQLHFYNKDYREIKIENDSVIYCDIPYKNTTGYDSGFNHEEFYEWAKKQTQPLFISEYNLDIEGFSCVWEKEVIVRISPNSKNNDEKIYYNNVVKL